MFGNVEDAGNGHRHQPDDHEEDIPGGEQPEEGDDRSEPGQNQHW